MLNSNTERYPLEESLLPMGGTTVKREDQMEKVWNSSEYWAEEKYDGSRYLCMGGRFFSRRESKEDKLPVEKTDRVPHLEEIGRYHLPDHIVDGEIYYEGKTSNEVTSILGSLPKRAVELQEERGKLKYVIYDILYTNGQWITDKPYHQRREILEHLYHVITTQDPSVEAYLEISNLEKTDKKNFNKRILLNGGEGVMLKNVNGKYHPDKKPRWNWIKVKTEIDDDVIITGYKDPVRLYEGKELESWQYWETEHGQLYLALEGRSEVVSTFIENGIEVEPVTRNYYNGWIGSLVFSKYNADGELEQVGRCTGINDKDRSMFTENQDKYLGEVIEIKAMEMTKDGHFRHPNFVRLRPDKNPEECVINEPTD